MDGPVAATRLAELAGAVEGIDDPDPLATQAAEVIGRLLGEHRVVWSCLGEGRRQELVGHTVALGAQRVGVGVGVGITYAVEAVPLPEFGEHHAGLRRQLGRQPVVGGIGPGAIGRRTAVG